MKYLTFICSGLVVIGFLLIFISGSFFNVAQYKKDSRLGLMRSMLTTGWSESEKKDNKKAVLIFSIGLAFIIIGLITGIYLQTF